MENEKILVVDDEKNIRLTMSMALKQMDVEVDTAINGEEALKKNKENKYCLIFLDIRMPGMDGIEVLRQLKKDNLKTRVVMITAHGSIETAVEAMKLGAVDFIQKPFSPNEIREIADKIIKREQLSGEEDSSYPILIELAKLSISNREFDKAREEVQKAIAKDPSHPEAFNLLGALFEIERDLLQAQKFYRAALDIDPTYNAAWTNLDRVTSINKFGTIDLGTKTDEEE